VCGSSIINSITNFFKALKLEIFNLFFSLLQVEAGDVILKINGTDVHRFSTKEGKYVECIINLSAHAIVTKFLSQY
jgi:hypothetical protein